VLFSADAGVVIHAPRLALELLYKAERGIPAAVEWLLKLLRTRHTKGTFKAAIWGLSVEQEITLCNSFELVPFASLTASSIRDKILARARSLYDHPAWISTNLFDKPRAALIREVSKFPYIRTDDASFAEIDRLAQEARGICTLMETTLVGRPLAFGFWFEYDEPDLDIAAWEGTITWLLPEIVPHVPCYVPVKAQVLRQDLKRYMALSHEIRSELLRSMSRFTLSQCRRDQGDRALDLALAFEIAVSGDGGSNAPPSWKVSVRAAQLIGGKLEKRQANRNVIGTLYQIRNAATHGSRSNSLKQSQKEALETSVGIYRDLVRSILRLGKVPNWNALELEPVFKR